MGLFTKRETPRPHVSSLQARPSEGHREPIVPVEDEMGLLGLGYDQRDDQLLRHALPSKPEDYFSSDPRHFHHEVL